MSDNRIGTLYLNSEESTVFIKSFYHPTTEEIEQHNQNLEEINNTITICRNNRGFSASIEDFNFSFLEQKIYDDQLTVTVKVEVKKTNEDFKTHCVDRNIETILCQKKEKKYATCVTSSTTNLAA